MFKVHAIVPKPLKDPRSGSINLAFTCICLAEGSPCARKTCSLNGFEFTTWDKCVVEGDLTVEEFMHACLKQFGMPLARVEVGNTVLYSAHLPGPDAAEYAGMKITDVVARADPAQLTERRDSVPIRAAFHAPEEITVETPPVYLKYR
jgi:hypothetical protein